MWGMLLWVTPGGRECRGAGWSPVRSNCSWSWWGWEWRDWSKNRILGLYIFRSNDERFQRWEALSFQVLKTQNSKQNQIYWSTWAKEWQDSCWSTWAQDGQDSCWSTWAQDGQESCWKSWAKERQERFRVFLSQGKARQILKHLSQRMARQLLEP